MNRYDERGPRFWRHERHRDEGRRDEGFGFERGNDSGRTAGDADHQPYSGNPYGYYPGQGREGNEPGRRAPREWGGRESRSSQPYGQREPYNARGGSQRARWGGPWNEEGGRYGEGSRYSESQYGTRQNRFEPYGDRYEPQFGEGPFADTSEAPGYFGSGNYGDGGASSTGGFDERHRARYPGSLGEDTFSSRESRRYRTGPKGYTRSDERIREDISERLMLADGIDSSEVSISVKEGRVSLEGTVPTRSMKHQIEDLADYTAGVTEVDNRIRVERAGSAPASNVQSAPSPKTTKQ
jgi:hypothetical protein